ncbi:MAG: formyltetrahydrofolate deformylase [Proteobacteria bacterium]|nr:formyltetrahydrofolate deformylase [Pseudomonadota bacterium]
MTEKRYILNLSCHDVRGIVAAVTGFLSEHFGFIIESAQFGDASTGIFFLRIEFRVDSGGPGEDALKKAFHDQVANRFAMRWQITDKSRKSRVLIMVSREGHCLNDLLYRYGTGQLAIEIPAIVSNHDTWRSVAEWHGIPYYHFPITKDTKPQQEAQVWEVVQRHNIDLVVLARYMQVLSNELCAKLSGRAINIHHSFLPSFKGAKPYHQAFDRGVKLIGATAHYVTPDLDEGPIIEQEVHRVDHTYLPEDLEAIGRDVECLALSRAIKYHTEQRVLLNGTKTVVFK